MTEEKCAFLKGREIKIFLGKERYQIGEHKIKNKDPSS